mmetsp:Transcript_19207/g.48523  ORF Transcript_19207/g.48523 Transcript_19207/m.48523 type:complete len:97 (+) Transcript_19207:370-660(+)
MTSRSGIPMATGVKAATTSAHFTTRHGAKLAGSECAGAAKCATVSPIHLHHPLSPSLHESSDPWTSLHNLHVPREMLSGVSAFACRVRFWRRFGDL